MLTPEHLLSGQGTLMQQYNVSSIILSLYMYLYEYNLSLVKVVNFTIDD